MTDYDLTTFSGRFMFYLNMTDPRTLLHSDEKVLQSKAFVEAYEAADKPGNGDYRYHKKICNAAIHPVTGEIIPRLFRVASIAPVNIPLVFLMITCPASNVPGTLFLHWLNQSYNTACNYANRAGAEQSMADTAKAYVLAVGSACAFAYGLGKLSARGPAVFRRFGVLIPCIATGMANVSNVGFTRIDELMNGAAVYDSNDQTQGMSVVAGRQGVLQTALTRCLLVPCSSMLLPPVIMAGLKQASLLPQTPKAVMAVELAVIYASLQLAMPCALAIFPQKAKIDVRLLEPKFQHLTDKQGNSVDYLYANKGL